MKKSKLKEAKLRKRNMKLYPFYQMIGNDILFYYGINFMFLSEVKGFTDSQIVLSNTFFAIFSLLMQLPITLIVSKIGHKKGAIIGNIINVVWAISIMLLNDYIGLIISELLAASAVTMKYVSDTSILGDSIPSSQYEAEIFIRIDKRAYSRYYIFLAISTVLSGYLYGINPYLPIIMCMVCSIVATIIAFTFTDIKKEKERRNNEIYTINKYFRELSQGLKFTITSKRLFVLFLFTGTIWGAISLAKTYELGILKELGAPAQVTAMVYAAISFMIGITARSAVEFHNRYRNKSLFNMLIRFAVLFFIMGCITISHINNPVKIIFIIIISLILASLNGVFSILQKKYLNNFTNDKISPSISSIKSICDNAFIIFSTCVGSLLLNYFDIGLSTVIIGLQMILGTILINIYSKDKLGLKPDQYSKKDIYTK